MSESEEVTQEATEEVTEETATESKANELSHEDALKELAKVRKEAAAKRVANKELSDKAAKYDEYLKSQMTEIQRKDAEIAELKEKNVELSVGSVREKVALKYGLDAETAQLFLGDLVDEDKLEERASAIAKLAPKDEKQKGKSFAGRRGSAVQPTSEEPPSFGSFLKGALDELDGTRITFK